MMETNFSEHQIVVKQQEEMFGQQQEQQKNMEEEIIALKTELEDQAKILLDKQDEITELNLLLDSKEKKIDNIQSMEDTTGIDITQHP